MYSGNGKNRTHSGEGHLVENIVVFVVLMAILVAGFYATSWTAFGSAGAAWWPMLAVIGGGTIAYGVGMALCKRTSQHPDVEANEAAVESTIDAEYAQALHESARRH